MGCTGRQVRGGGRFPGLRRDPPDTSGNWEGDLGTPSRPRTRWNPAGLRRAGVAPQRAGRGEDRLPTLQETRARPRWGGSGTRERDAPTLHRLCPLPPTYSARVPSRRGSHVSTDHVTARLGRGAGHAGSCSFRQLSLLAHPGSLSPAPDSAVRSQPGDPPACVYPVIFRFGLWPSQTPLFLPGRALGGLASLSVQSPSGPKLSDSFFLPVSVPAFLPRASDPGVSFTEECGGRFLTPLTVVFSTTEDWPEYT